jgi:quinol monooxygenase YgiN
MNAILVMLASLVSRSSNQLVPVVCEHRAVRYGYFGTMRVKAGHRDEVVATLVGGADGLKAAGCDLYVVGTSDSDKDTVWVSEVWVSKQAHDDSLQLPEVKAAIAKTMPLLTGEFTSQELDVAGGLGVPD